MKGTVMIGSFCMLASLVQGCSSSPGAAAEAAPTMEETAVVHTVQMMQMKFEPATISVNKGDQIVFFNADIVTHNVTEETRGAWASPPIPPGESWTLVAEQSDRIYCSLHPMMKGVVTVE
jgi:plastocyanin